MLKLSNFRLNDEDTYGKYHGGRIYPVSETFKKKFPSLRSVIEYNTPKDLDNIFNTSNEGYLVEQGSLLPPISLGTRVFCVGLNYPKKRLMTSPNTSKDEMIIFSKELDCFVGSESPITIPTGHAGKTLDYEGELALVVGKPGKNISPEEASKHIFGFTIVNDGSIREWQKHSLFAGKNFEHSSSCGPCILVYQGNLKPESFLLSTKLNGHLVQKSEIGNMIFKCSEIISYISSILPLKPGDLIATGSPDGSGITRDPKRFLKDGDELEIEISNIGILRNKISAYNRSHF